MTIKFFNQPFMIHFFNVAKAQSYSHVYHLYDSHTGYDYAFVTILKCIKPLKEEYGVYQTY